MKKYGDWVKFKNLPKKDKIFRVINIVLMIAMFLTTLGFLIYYSVTGDKNNRLAATIAMLVIYLIPFAIEIVLQRRIANLITFYFLVYALFAGLIGCVLNVYKITTWYDIPIHILAGYTFSFFGIIILSRLENYKNLKPLTVIIFCLFCTLAVELVWELMEWFADNVVGQTAQGEVVEGYNAPLVTDTDLDMLCNLTGGIIFAIQFLIGKYTRFSLGVNFFERELCPQPKIEEEAEKTDESLNIEENPKIDENGSKETEEKVNRNIDNP